MLRFPRFLNAWRTIAVLTTPAALHRPLEVWPLPLTTVGCCCAAAVDPVPPAEDDVSVEALQATLADEGTDMFDRYRAMFALRNRAGKQLAEMLVIDSRAIAGLPSPLCMWRRFASEPVPSFACAAGDAAPKQERAAEARGAQPRAALPTWCCRASSQQQPWLQAWRVALRPWRGAQICYVLGQLQDPSTLSVLQAVLADDQQHAMVSRRRKSSQAGCCRGHRRLKPHHGR